MKNQKGITLIALVITIIVMLILVGVSVTVALNGGLFATAQKATTDTETERDKELALSDGRVKVNGVWYDKMEDYIANKPSANQEDEIEGNGATQRNLIPEGGTYTIKATDEILSEGDYFPVTITNGDTYEYGDYIYTYQTSNNGWKFEINTAVTDYNQTSYSQILGSINGAFVTTSDNAFMECDNLVGCVYFPCSVTDWHLPGSAWGEEFHFNGCGH